MVVLIFIVVVFVLPLGTLKYLGSRAMTPASIEISGLTLNQITEIGTRASVSAFKRMLSIPQADPTPSGGAEWGVGSRGGRMAYLVEPMGAGTFRVTAAATLMRIAQKGGSLDPRTDWGKAGIITNVLFRFLGIPHNPRVLLRQRRRVLRALNRAGTSMEAKAQGSM